MTQNVDIVVIADFRDPGGIPAVVAAEVRAQATAGLATVLVQVPRPGTVSPPRRGAAPFRRPVVDLLRAGAAELAFDRDPVAARVLVIRQPEVFADETVRLPEITAERTVVVVDPAPDDGGPPFNLAEIAKRIQDRFGPDIEWAPTGPVARDQLTECLPAAALSPHDWTVAASHLDRLAAVGVRPRLAVPAPRTQSRSAASAPPAAPSAARRPTVLMISSNGAGLGHLSRLMAIARRLPGDVRPVVATQSYGLSLAHQAGFLSEYIPSRKSLSVPMERWNVFLRERLRHLIALHRPAVVAVDSVPHLGFLAAIEDHPDVTWVWVRRAMWKPGVGTEFIARGAAYDAVLEPGEFAATVDVGPTVAHRDQVRMVDPIMFFDDADLHDRTAARHALGLDDRPAALLQLGAGNINDISSPVSRTAQLLGRNGWRVVLAESPIAVEPLACPPSASVVRLYPVSSYLRGFDLVVSAAGYNSYHESLKVGVPTVFVPNPNTGLDDQMRRARYAADVGAALVIEEPDGDELEAVLARAVDVDVRAALVERCAEMTFQNGAAAAAVWMASMCSVRSGG